jgi:tRNA dimethylallyltransferase
MIIGLTTNRKELYRRIDLRVDGMIAQGLVTEVQRLIDMGYHQELPAMSSIGYWQVSAYLSGELLLNEAVQQIKHHTHRLVRQQYNWFRLRDERITWFDIMYNRDAEVAAMVTEFLSTQQLSGT